jgi:hypothetical protein
VKRCPQDRRGKAARHGPLVMLSGRRNNASMKLGVYGWDLQIAAVVRAARREGAVAVACHAPADDLLAGARVADSWEALIDERACEAILVGSTGWDDARADGVRHLVQAGRPLLLSHPLTPSMLLAYEFDMIRADVGGVVLPFLPDRQHPFVVGLRDAVEGGLVGGGRLGRLESMSLVRRIPNRSKDAALSWLARDADLIRLLIGEPQRLSTLASLGSEAAYASLTVEFGGESQVPARWQVARGDTPLAELTLTGDAGQIRVTIPDSTLGPAVWRWQDLDGEHEAEAFDGGSVMMESLARAMSASASVLEEGAQPAASWADAARAIELAETVPRSLARGRAIDLHQEEFTELGTFKGTMASLGCGLVMIGLLVLVVATVIGGIAHKAGWAFGEQLTAIWPFVVLAALGGFLALQLLPLLIQGPREK